ncbi:hypothetical protein [Streptomyces sp. NPDC086838]|uniref:hypothetical protein n=1 Tax=Streptomyces sp. NPDC086838 TaxID=3365762 RepID=UPI00382A2B50
MAVVGDVKRLVVAAALASAKGDEDGLVALIQGLEPQMRDAMLYGLTRSLVGVTDQAWQAKGAAVPRAMTLASLTAEALDVAGE